MGKGPESKIDADAIIGVIGLCDQVVIVPLRCQELMVLWRRPGVDVASVCGGTSTCGHIVMYLIIYSGHIAMYGLIKGGK